MRMHRIAAGMIIPVCVLAGCAEQDVIERSYDSFAVTDAIAGADSETLAIYHDLDRVFTEVLGGSKLVEYYQQGTTGLQPSSYLIFVVNRTITDADMETVRRRLAEAGYRSRAGEIDPLVLNRGVAYIQTVVLVPTLNAQGVAAIRVLIY